MRKVEFEMDEYFCQIFAISGSLLARFCFELPFNTWFEMLVQENVGKM